MTAILKVSYMQSAIEDKLIKLPTDIAIFTSDVCHLLPFSEVITWYSRYLQMLERSECTQPGTLETFPWSLLPNWNFHNLSHTLDTELIWESPQSVPDTGHRALIWESGNMLRSQGQDKEISTWRARASLLSLVLLSDVHQSGIKTNKQMAGRGCSVQRLIWNVLFVWTLAPDFELENTGMELYLRGRRRLTPDWSLTNILYFLFWAGCGAAWWDARERTIRRMLAGQEMIGHLWSRGNI